MFDCLVIPNAVTNNNVMIKGNQFCGKYLAAQQTISASASAMGQTVCSKNDFFGLTRVRKILSKVFSIQPANSRSSFSLSRMQ
jgi:hypothetical protein